MIREPPDYTGNEPTLDIPIGSMLIMKHNHHQTIEKESKNLQYA